MPDALTLTMRAVAAIVAAIQNEGPEPAFHREAIRRHRREWPSLWRALDKLLRAEAETRRIEG